MTSVVHVKLRETTRIWTLAYERANPGQHVTLRPSPKIIMTAALKAAHRLYADASAVSPVFRRTIETWKAFHGAQYQRYEVTQLSFGNFMAGQQLPFR